MLVLFGLLQVCSNYYQLDIGTCIALDINNATLAKTKSKLDRVDLGMMARSACLLIP